ncbi:MAG: hypothetical protein AAF587_09680 [Bacteroidota bacterium]
MKRLLGFLLLFILLILGISAVWAWVQLRDRFPNYQIDLHIQEPEQAVVLQAGFAKTSITPSIPDSWTDVNQDATFQPDDGDIFDDRNGNGKFDTQWIAGFGQRRAALGVHDSLWARAVVFDDGLTRMAIVVIDAIGFGHDDVVRVRQRISESAGLTYVTITSTHVHQAPDLIGLWGKGYLSSGVDPAYMELVVSQTARAVEQAVEALEPANLRIAQDLSGAEALLTDTRDPKVFDPGLRIIQAIGQPNGQTLGTLLFWADHPETLWSDNLLISSDFPHAFRQGVEQGVYDGDSLVVAGVGGISLYINGAIGGLMTTHPTTPIPDPFRDTTYLEPSFDKAEAQGKQLALLTLAALRDSSAETIDKGGISLYATSLLLPLDNHLFRLAATLGIFERGMPKWMQMRSELAVWQIGPISCLQMPGEIYPELLYGGIEAPIGQDFEIDPVEVPPLEQFMPGTYKCVIGMANDMIGYIIPKSEWDADPPYLYESEHAHYGEVNSIGPETAPLLYKETRALLKGLSSKATSTHP